MKTEPNHSLSDKYKFLKLPILRGILSLFEMLIIGIQTLSYSASVAGEGEEGTYQQRYSFCFDFSCRLAVALFIVLPLLQSGL